ncbi:MAG: hypothetical protein ACE5KK_00145 [Candidatus Brocadiales bacterium]
MNRHSFIIPSLVLAFALSLPAVVGQEKSSDEQKSASSGTEAGPDKDQKTNEEGRHKEAKSKAAPQRVAPESTPGGRDFLRFAEPKTKKKKPKTRPYGSYWMAPYGGKMVDEDEDVFVEESVRPYFSPYGTSTEPAESKELKLSPLTPPPLSEFIEADFARLASGSYVSEYADKFVKMRCKFASLAPEGMRLKEFPAPDYVNFLVTGTGSTMFSLTVVAPREKASKVFGLESQKEIILYGRAVRLGLSGLTLVVEEVEGVEKAK